MYNIFTVIKNSQSDYDELHNLIVTETDNIPNIPNESIECIKRKSSLRSSYRMTDEQADILRGNSNIRAVELDLQYNTSDSFRLNSNRYASETYCHRPQYRAFYKKRYATNPDIYGYDFPWKHMGTSSNTSLRQTYSKLEEYAKKSETYENRNLIWLEPTNLSDSNSDVLSWSKIRTKYKYNPWQNVSSGIIQNDNILNGRDGSDVDIVIQDNGVDKYHPDFLDSQSNSRVRDVVVHGPEYVDPTYFANNPTKTYLDWWEDSSSRSSQFQSLDTITVPRFTVLHFLVQVNSPSLSTFQNNVGKVITQTVNGAEYTRGKIIEVFDSGLGSWVFAVKVQLDRGKPHFRYWYAEKTGNPYGGTYPATTSSPGYLTIDPSGSNVTHVGPNIAGGFVYNESSVLMNNPNNTPIDSTGNKTIAETMAIDNGNGYGANIWIDGVPGSLPTPTGDYYSWDTTTNPSTWQGYTLEYHQGLGGRTRTHGTHCASEAAGNKFGYAPNANIWSTQIAISGQTFVYGEVALDPETSFDAVRIFHEAKPVNPSYGNKNPTILNGSWGSSQWPFSTFSDGDSISYSYRGASSTYTYTASPPSGDTATPDFIKNTLYKYKWKLGNEINGINYETEGGQQSLTYLYYGLNKVDVQTAGEECLNSGVHMVFSSGNNNNYQVKDSSDQDYNNYVVNGAGDNVYLHRLGSPSSIAGSINVGALSCSTRTDGSERKDYYSNKGPGVDIYAPALNTISANSQVKHNINTGEGATHWNTIYAPEQDKDTLYKYFSGTSSASPNVVGVMALFLQKNRTATTTQAKEWLLGTSSSYRTSGSYIDNNLPNTSLPNFWGDHHDYTTSLSIVDEQTYSVGNVSIVLDANHHIAMTETGESFMDSDVKLLYNPYASTNVYDESDLALSASMVISGNLSITGNIDFRTNVSPDFEILSLPASVDEGQSISPTIGATPAWKNLITDGSYRVYWDISGVSIASTDFSSVGADGNPDTGTFLSGYVDVSATATSKQFPIGVTSDNYTDDPSGANINANETATLSIYRDSSRTQLLDSSDFIINDTSTASNFEFLLVGGGGAGGRMSSSTSYTSFSAAGGGGAGGVRVVSDSDIFDNHSNIWVEIGAGGLSAQAGESTYLKDTDTNGAEVYSVGGGGYGASSTSSTAGVTGGSAPGAVSDPRGSGGGGNRASYTQQGWTYSSGGGSGAYGNDGGGSQSQYGGGGGGGAGSVGDTKGSTSDGFGGTGYDLTNFFSELSGDGHDGGDKIAGGGGGGQSRYAEGGIFSSSSSGSGNDGGGSGGGFANSGNGYNAAANTGAGGGGAAGTRGAAGGSGGSGIVYLKYTSETQLVGNWTGTASDHTVTSYDQSVAGGTKRTWIHKMIGNGALSLL